MAHARPTPQSEDIARIRSFLTALLVMSLVWLPVDFVLGIVLGQRRFFYTCLLLLAFIAMTVVAIREAGKGRVERAALLDGLSFLVFALALEFLLPLATPVLVAIPLIAFTLVIPFVRGRTLRLFAASAVITALA